MKQIMGVVSQVVKEVPPDRVEGAAAGSGVWRMDGPSDNASSAQMFPSDDFDIFGSYLAAPPEDDMPLVLVDSPKKQKITPKKKKNDEDDYIFQSAMSVSPVDPRKCAQKNAALQARKDEAKKEGEEATPAAKTGRKREAVNTGQKAAKRGKPAAAPPRDEVGRERARGWEVD